MSALPIDLATDLDLSRIRAITLDLDDTLWPVWPTIARAEAQLQSWLQQHAPAAHALAGQPGMDGLTPVPQAIVDGTAQAMRVQTGGLGGAFVWPTMLRQLEKQGAGYRT